MPSSPGCLPTTDQTVLGRVVILDKEHGQHPVDPLREPKRPAALPHFPNGVGPVRLHVNVHADWGNSTDDFTVVVVVVVTTVIVVTATVNITITATTIFTVAVITTARDNASAIAEDVDSARSKSAMTLPCQGMKDEMLESIEVGVVLPDGISKQPP